MYLCTQENIQTCPLLIRLNDQKVGTDAMRKIIDAACPDLPTDCASNGPVTVQKGSESPWQRCDMHPEVITRVGAIASALESGAVSVSTETVQAVSVNA